MPKGIKLALFISLVAMLLLSACSGETADWKVFSIDQEPAINIQFRLPPNWLVDYAPIQNHPGQWNITLVPPKCSPVQEMEYQQNCVNLIAYIKGTSTFSEDEFMSLIEGSFPLSQDGSQSALFLGQDTFRVNRINMQQYNHLIRTATGEVQMSTTFFETDSAYFTFITNFPYNNTENEAVESFDLMLRSVAVTK